MRRRETYRIVEAAEHKEGVTHDTHETHRWRHSMMRPSGALVAISVAKVSRRSNGVGVRSVSFFACQTTQRLQDEPPTREKKDLQRPQDRVARLEPLQLRLGMLPTQRPARPRRKAHRPPRNTPRLHRHVPQPRAPFNIVRVSYSSTRGTVMLSIPSHSHPKCSIALL
jgi:hypothetical protein